MPRLGTPRPALAVLALGAASVRQAIHLRRFSPDVVLCLGADFDLDEDQRGLLAARGVTVLDTALASVGGDVTRCSSRGSAASATSSGPGCADGVLAERFARGEIDENEYRQRLSALREHP